MRRNKIIGAFMTVLISFVTFGVVVVLYTAHAIHDSERQICGIITLSTKPRPIPPPLPFDPSVDPSTEYGRELDAYLKAKQQYDKELEAFNLTAGRELRAYSHQIGCPQ